MTKFVKYYDQDAIVVEAIVNSDLFSKEPSFVIKLLKSNENVVAFESELKKSKNQNTLRLLYGE